MKTDFFTQLEIELSELNRAGAHRGEDRGRRRRRLVLAARRGAAIFTLAIALAASLDSEFPATARGTARTPMVQPA
jgi:hypothetical protein